MFLSGFFSTTGMDQQPKDYFFGPYHLIYFLIAATIIVSLFFFLKNKPRKIQDRYITIFLIIILILKYSTEGLFIYEYNHVFPALSKYPHPFWDINTFFSFQLCGVMNILLPIVIWFNIKPLKGFVFASSILGGLAVLFYPVTVLYGDPFMITLPMVRSAFVHMFLILIPVFLIYRGDVVLNAKKWKHIAIGLLSLAAWAMFGNLFIDKNANNMYLMSNPFYGGPIPILNRLPNGYHVIFLAVAVTIGYFIVFQIAGIFTRLGKHQRTIEIQKNNSTVI
jgi:hypothetical protein